jgi:DNA-binding MarR family transcriptional regulator
MSTIFLDACVRKYLIARRTLAAVPGPETDTETRRETRPETRRESRSDAVEWLTRNEMKAWRTLLDAATGLLATLDQELQAAHGLSLAEYEVLVVLSGRGDEGVRMQDLAGMLHLSPSGATRRIDSMVRRALVARRQCPTDRRGSFAVLTEVGSVRLREAAPTHVRGVRAHFIDRLSERQLANVTNALAAIDVDEAAAAGGCDER